MQVAHQKPRRAGASALAVALLGLIAFTPAAPANAASEVKVALRRITESQYRHTIADVFGPAAKVEARFEPERREEGLLAIGSAVLSLTSSGFEQYFVLGSSIAEQVLSDEQALGCAVVKPADDACARQFIERYGEMLFRRPLTRAEIDGRFKIVARAPKQAGDSRAGLKLALTSLLVAPEFLFRIETAETDPESPGQLRLNGYTKAARLSYLFWDSSPDAELIAAARSGEIHTKQGLERQVARLVASPRFDQGARAFFVDMLQLEGFGNLIKDSAIYPKFNQSVAESAKEQMLRTTMDLLIRNKADYRDLFTTNTTFINRSLASVYSVPFASSAEWTTYTFPPSAERSGIVTDIGFLSLHSHPGASSPTRRGIKVLEIFMCQSTPNPPANVDFSTVQDSTKGTVRGRLLDHMENEGCSGCHRRTDPIGLSLEHFDGLGQLRTTENGMPIDVTADLKSASFEGAQGLGKYLRDDPRVPACLVRNVYSYGTGAKTFGRDRPYLQQQTEQFAKNGHRVPDLMAQIAITPEFFRVIVPKDTPTPAPADSVTARIETSQE
jgi:hypothetical protein